MQLTHRNSLALVAGILLAAFAGTLTGSRAARAGIDPGYFTMYPPGCPFSTYPNHTRAIASPSTEIASVTYTSCGDKLALSAYFFDSGTTQLASCGTSGFVTPPGNYYRECGFNLSALQRIYAYHQIQEPTGTYSQTEETYAQR